MMSDDIASPVDAPQSSSAIIDDSPIDDSPLEEEPTPKRISSIRAVSSTQKNDQFEDAEGECSRVSTMILIKAESSE